MIRMYFDVAVALFASEDSVLTFTEWLLFHGIEVFEDEGSLDDG